MNIDVAVYEKLAGVSACCQLLIAGAKRYTSKEELLGGFCYCFQSFSCKDNYIHFRERKDPFPFCQVSLSSKAFTWQVSDAQPYVSLVVSIASVCLSQYFPFFCMCSVRGNYSGWPQGPNLH